MSEIRQNPVTKDWGIIASERGKSRMISRSFPPILTFANIGPIAPSVRGMRR
jgi:hypothetical protein